MLKRIGRLLIVIVLALAIALGLFISTDRALEKNTTYFAGSGYVLLTDINVEAEKVFFTTEQKYKMSGNSEIIFEDIQNKKTTIPEDTFFHFDGNYISALVKGVFTDLDEVGNDFITHYQIDPGTMIENGNKITVNAGSEPRSFDDIILKLNDDRYIILGNKLKAYFAEDDIRECGNFVELHYLDRGVCQIITEDNVWQTVSPEVYIDVDGKTQVYPILERMVNVETGREAFLNSLVVDADDNMHLRDEQQKNVNNIIPHFDVVTEDGKTGESGKTGETAKQGASGNEGTNGKAGTAGDDGLSGSIGSNGKDGVSADSDASARQEIPTMTLNTWNVSSSKISGTITLNDTYGAVVTAASEGTHTDEDYVHAYVMKTDGTDQIPVVAYSLDKDNRESVSEIITFNEAEPTTFKLADGYELEPDTEYVFVVHGKYTMNHVDITRDFIYRTFYTDSIGVNLSTNQVTTTSISVDVNKNDYSTATQAYVFLLTEEQNKQFTEEIAKETIKSLAPKYHYGTTVFEDDETIEFGVVDTEYTLDVDTQYIARLMIAYKEFASDTEVKYKLSNIDYPIRTLKRIPKVIGQPTVATNRQNKSFEIYSAEVDDVDNSIVRYIYEIYDNESHSGTSSLLKTIEVNADTFAGTNYTVLYIDDETITFNHSYYVKEYVVYNDNYKEVTLNANVENKTLQSSVFEMMGSQLPSTSFRYVTDSFGNEIGQQYDRIRGWINISLNNSKIIVDDKHPIYVTMVAEGIFSKTMQFTGEESNLIDIQENLIQVYIDENGLYRDTVYRLTVDAWVDCDEDNTGDATEEYIYRNVGNIIVNTKPMPVLKAVWSPPIKSGLGKITRRLQFEAANAEEESYVKSTLSVVEVTLYSGSSSSNIVVGTKEFTDEAWARDDEDYISTISESLFEGEDLSNTSFGKQNKDLTAESYSIVVTAAYDYTKQSQNPGLKSGLYNQFVVLEADSGIIGAEAQPPALPGLGDENKCVTVKEITKGNALVDFGINVNYKKYENVANHAVIGYEIKSNYDNYGKLARKVTYYGFEAGGLDYYINQCTKGYNSEYDPQDPHSGANAIELFDVTLDVPSTNVLPSLIVLFGDCPDDEVPVTYDNPALNYKDLVTKEPYYNPTNGKYYFYAGNVAASSIVKMDDEDRLISGMDRGYIYSFSYKVKYAPSAISTTEADYKTYPNEPTEDFNNWCESAKKLLVLRSPYCFAPKIKPTFQSYPLLTDESKLVLYYRYVDPDNLVKYNDMVDGELYTSRFVINHDYIGSASNPTVVDAVDSFDAPDAVWQAVELNNVVGVLDGTDLYATISIEGSEYEIGYDMKKFGIDDYKGSIDVYHTPWSNTKSDVLKNEGENIRITINDKDYISKNNIKVNIDLGNDIKEANFVGAYLVLTPPVESGLEPLIIMCEFEQAAIGYSATIPLSKLSAYKGLELDVDVQVLYDTNEFGYIGIEIDNQKDGRLDSLKPIASLTSFINSTDSTGRYTYLNNPRYYSLTNGYYALQAARLKQWVYYYVKSITDEGISTKQDNGINSYFTVTQTNADSMRYTASHLATPSAKRYFSYSYEDGILVGAYRENYFSVDNGLYLVPKMVGAVTLSRGQITTIRDDTTKKIRVTAIVPTSTQPYSSTDTESITISGMKVSGADQIFAEGGERNIIAKLYKLDETIDDYVYLPLKKTTINGRYYYIPVNRIAEENPEDGTIKFISVDCTVETDDGIHYYYKPVNGSVGDSVQARITSIDSTTKVGNVESFIINGLEGDVEYRIDYSVKVENDEIDPSSPSKEVGLIDSNDANSNQLKTVFRTDSMVRIYDFTMRYSETETYESKVFTSSFQTSQINNIKVVYSILDVSENLLYSFTDMIDMGMTTEDKRYSNPVTKSFKLTPGMSDKLVPGGTYILKTEVFSTSGILLTDPANPPMVEFTIPAGLYPSGNIDMRPVAMSNIEGEQSYGYTFKVTPLSDDTHYIVGNANGGQYVVRLFDNEGNLVDGSLPVTYNSGGNEVSTTLQEVYNSVFYSNSPTLDYTVLGLDPNRRYRMVVYASVDRLDYDGRNDNLTRSDVPDIYKKYAEYTMQELLNEKIDGMSVFDYYPELRSYYMLFDKTKSTPDASGVSVGSTIAQVNRFHTSQVQLVYFDSVGIEKIDKLVVSIVHKSGSPSLSAMGGEVSIAARDMYYDTESGTWTYSLSTDVFAATKDGVYDIIVEHYIGDTLAFTYEGNLVK